MSWPENVFLVVQVLITLPLAKVCAFWFKFKLHFILTISLTKMTKLSILKIKPLTENLTGSYMIKVSVLVLRSKSKKENEHETLNEYAGIWWHSGGL